eukprot:2769808-Heterocapsa_arctica.AAC.1
MGLCSGCDADDNMIDVLEIYRAPQCLRCTLRVDFYVAMDIQVNDDGMARWQCELCDDVISWQ